MTAVESDTEPGQEIAPAFSSRRPSILRYRLTAEDALIWEQRRREFTKAEKRFWVLVVFLTGVTYGATEGLLPVWFTALHGLVKIAIIAAIVFAGQMIWMNIRHHRRARQRFPEPVEMQCEVLVDRLSARPEKTAGEEVHVTPATIRQVLVDRDRLFIDDESGLLILPLSAFQDRADMLRVAAVWEQASKDAAP